MMRVFLFILTNIAVLVVLSVALRLLGVESILDDTCRNLFDGVKERDVSQALVMSARTLIEKEPNYSYAAARLLMDMLRREALGFLRMDTNVATQQEMGERYSEYFTCYIKCGADLELLDELPSGNRAFGSSGVLRQLDGDGAEVGVVDAQLRHLERVGAEVGDRHGATLGNPDLQSAHMDSWKEGLVALAALPNVAVKISGLITRCGGQWNADMIRPWTDFTIKQFGSTRLVYGGDWPVVLRAGTYQQWSDLFEVLTNDLTYEEKQQVYFQNAERIYGLDH